MEYPNVPAKLLKRIRSICMALPEATEDENVVGTNFRIRRRIFTYLLAVENPRGGVDRLLVVQADPEEREALLASGHPYFPSNSGRHRVGIVLDDAPDFEELTELITVSYLLNAPKKLAALVEPPA